MGDDDTEGNTSFFRYNLLTVEFLLIPIVLFFILYGAFSAFSYKTNLILFSVIFFYFGFTHILFLTGMRNSSVFKDDKLTEIITYSGVVISVIFCVLFLLSPDLYFHHLDAELSFDILFTHDLLLLGSIFWAISFLLIAYQVYRSSTEKSYIVYVGASTYGFLLPGYFFSFIELEEEVCYLYLAILLLSAVMIVATSYWVKMNFDHNAPNYCKICGYQLDEESEYCENCGYKLNR